MSSEAESKGGSFISIGTAGKLLGHWLWLALLIVLLCGFLVGLLLGPAEKSVVQGPTYEQLVDGLKEDLLRGSLEDIQIASRGSDVVPISPATYSALLQDLRWDLRQELATRSQEAPLMPQAVQVVDAGPAGQAGGSCDIEQIRLTSDPRFSPKSMEIRGKLNHSSYPTFEQLYFLVVNREYDPEQNIWSSFPNAYNLTANFHFPFSNLHEGDVDRALTMLGRPPQLAVEVGSFHGHSAILQAKKMDEKLFVDTPLLCIDPWTGDLGMLLFRDDWDKKLTPGELADGRSTSYWQFMLNVKSQIEAKAIGPKHIIPMAVTSIVGARYLIAVGLTPDMIYLDSAHEFDETFTELTLYYHTLAAGGVIYGDDFLWEAVAHDVKRFAEKQQLQLLTEGNQWFLQKPAGAVAQ
mmetsp:Transcript_4818/g.8656  ORF Transcript_4818/g.8656 Transcript_4818/m.8656 type:complete len:408 (+) Transcript_4818:129-1352(+)